MQSLNPVHKPGTRPFIDTRDLVKPSRNQERKQNSKCEISRRDLTPRVGVFGMTEETLDAHQANINGFHINLLG